MVPKTYGTLNMVEVVTRKKLKRGAIMASNKDSVGILDEHDILDGRREEAQRREVLSHWPSKRCQQD